MRGMGSSKAREGGAGEYEIDDEDELEDPGDSAAKWPRRMFSRELMRGRDDRASRSNLVRRNTGHPTSSSSSPDHGFVIRRDEWYKSFRFFRILSVTW